MREEYKTVSAIKEQGQILPLESGVLEVRNVLGEKAAALLPGAKQITGITRDNFVSRTYKEEEGPTIKQAVDGHMYKVSFGDGSETYVLHHKTTGGNPFLDPALFGELLPQGGLDGRTYETFTYEWDGKNMIKATAPDGKVTNVGDGWGTPDKMLPPLNHSLGHHMNTIQFANSVAPTLPPTPLQP